MATDGLPVPRGARLPEDAVNVARGEQYAIDFVAEEPGARVFHCYFLRHATDDDRESGGLLPPSERFSPFDPRYLTAFAVGASQRRRVHPGVA